MEVIPLLSLVRQSGRIIVLKTRHGEQTAEWVRNRLAAWEYGLREALNEGKPDQTIVIISSTGKVEDLSSSFVVDKAADELLELLFRNNDLPADLELKLLPRSIHFRITGEARSIIDQIERDFHGTRTNVRDFLFDTSEKGVAVLFSEKPLNQNITIEDLFPDMLYIRMPFQSLFHHLQWRAMTYFNEGLKGREWNLVEIRIYDSYGRYHLHCERLRLFLEACEMGLTIGEGWGKDYAHILMPLQVYTMKILTFYDLHVLKKALMALEYTEEGDRFVDFDLYSQKKKVGWTELSEDKNRNRQQHAMKFRTDVMATLSDPLKKEIHDLEKEIQQAASSRNIPGKA